MARNLDKQFFKMTEFMVTSELPRQFVCFTWPMVKEGVVYSEWTLSTMLVLLYGCGAAVINLQSLFVVFQDCIVKVLKGLIILRDAVRDQASANIGR